MVIPTITTLTIPASSTGNTISVTGSVINKVELIHLGNIIATWTCTSNTTGTWAANANQCQWVGNPLYYARAQGPGYLVNKIDYGL